MTRRQPSPVRWECRACEFNRFKIICTKIQKTKPRVCAIYSFDRPIFVWRRVSKKKGAKGDE
jgi:hypothetical protein